MKTPMKLKSFKKCQAGNVSMMFAAAILPILGTVGLAVDFSRASEVKSQLTAAVDSTALALAHTSVNLTDKQLQAKANDLFKGNFKPGTPANSSSVRADRDNGELTVNGAAAFETSFLRFLNVSTLDVTAKSKVVWGSNQKIEVVLALDNTGSMAGKKLEELKKAAKELVDTLEAAQAPGQTGTVKIGLVPFASTVRVDPASYKNKSWIRFDKINYVQRECTRKQNQRGEWYDDCKDVPKTRDFNKSAWQGCIEDRDQPYDVDDTSFDKKKSNTLYPATESCPSQERDLQTVQPLTTDFNKVRTAIGNMEAAGSTNVTIGIAWGMSLLSSKQPFNEGAATTSQSTTNNGSGNNPSVTTGANVKKYLIILTDGENTKNRFTTNTSAIDARTKLACQAARDMGTIFTIRMIEGNENLLKTCASDPANYHDVKLAENLTTVFRAVGNEIANLRVAE